MVEGMPFGFESAKLESSETRKMEFVVRRREAKLTYQGPGLDKGTRPGPSGVEMYIAAHYK